MASASSKETAAVEVQRIDFIAAIWFVGTLIATSVPLGGLLASGWRPSQLDPGFVEAWWLGAVLIVIGMAVLVWAGCPVAGFPIEIADRQKAITIRAGIVLYGVGAVMAAVAVLLSA